MHHFIQSMQAIPFCSSNTTIYRFTPVKSCISFWYIVAMPVGNISFVICKHGVVAGVGVQLHIFFVRFQAGSFGTSPALYQTFHGAVIAFYTYVFTIPFCHNGTMTGVHGVKYFFLHTVVIFNGNTDRFYFYRKLFMVVFIKKLFVFGSCFFNVIISHIHITAGMYPPAMFIKTLVHKKLSPGNCSISIQAIFTYYMHLWPKVKSNMRIDIQNCIT